MKIIYALLFLLYCNIYAASFEWNFEKHYTDNLLYIHPLLNYELNPLWHYSWEKGLLRENGMKLSFGSVEIDDLLCNAQVVINKNLSNGWWFRAYNKWYASQHKNTEEKFYFMGLEKTVLKKISLFFHFGPAFNKEEFDIKMGISITDSKFEKYLRVALCLDDFVYDKKNDNGGKSTREPIGIQWLMRYGNKKLWLYSEGKYSTGFERNYPAIERSPEITFHQQQINNLIVKLYYHFFHKSLSSLSFSHYHFAEKKLYYKSNYNYSYLNEIYDFAWKIICQLNKKNRIRLVSHYVIQNSSCGGFKNFTYKRSELLPAIFYEYILNKSIWEIGFMGSKYNWDYNAKNSIDDYNQNNFVDKVKLGWTYNFNKNASIQISVSHIISITGFGGGNLQYLMFF